MTAVKLDNADVQAIQARLANGETVRAIAVDYPVSYQTIHNIKVGKRTEHPVGRYHLTKRRPQREITIPVAPPEEPAQVAQEVEQEARAAARRDRRAGGLAKDAFHRRSRATQHAAQYYVQHPSLYQRDTKEARRAAYEEWMNRYLDWYEDEATGKKKHTKKD